MEPSEGEDPDLYRGGVVGSWFEAQQKTRPFFPPPISPFFRCRERISEPLTAICMQSSGTRLGITFLIVINGIMIGMETDQRLQGEGWEVSF